MTKQAFKVGKPLAGKIPPCFPNLQYFALGRVPMFPKIFALIKSQISVSNVVFYMRDHVKFLLPATFFL